MTSFFKRKKKFHGCVQNFMTNSFDKLNLINSFEMLLEIIRAFTS